jgi:hypothetical protein
LNPEPSLTTCRHISAQEITCPPNLTCSTLTGIYLASKIVNPATSSDIKSHGHADCSTQMHNNVLCMIIALSRNPSLMAFTRLAAKFHQWRYNKNASYPYQPVSCRVPFDRAHMRRLSSATVFRRTISSNHFLFLTTIRNVACCALKASGGGFINNAWLDYMIFFLVLTTKVMIPRLACNPELPSTLYAATD